MRLRHALASLLAVGLVAPMSGGVEATPGHDHRHDQAYGQPGDPRKPARIVQIVMREAGGRMMFVPDRVVVRRGEQVRFQLRNDGEIDHELVLATVEQNLAHMKAMENAPDMAHDEPNAQRLKPKARAEILWRFTRTGEFDFSCLISGHRQFGMFGTVTVR
jgi:uncharacterized cupredoxin-like copper-binding protein